MTSALWRLGSVTKIPDLGLPTLGLILVDTSDCMRTRTDKRNTYLSVRFLSRTSTRCTLSHLHCRLPPGPQCIKNTNELHLGPACSTACSALGANRIRTSHRGWAAASLLYARSPGGRCGDERTRADNAADCCASRRRLLCEPGRAQLAALRLWQRGRQGGRAGYMLVPYLNT